MTLQEAKDTLWDLVDGWPGTTEPAVGNKVDINVALCKGDIDAAYAKMEPEYLSVQARKAQLGL